MDIDEAKREIAALHERIGRLCAAMEHINSSLDPDTVLEEILKNARTLTGAARGVIVTVDDTGNPLDYTSSGITASEERRLFSSSDGPRLFANFRDVGDPLRLPNLDAYARGLGFGLGLPAENFLGTPMHHRGVYVGSFFISGKDGGGEFTADDQEALDLLASQAATSIANARAHRAERQARADLEVLVETSPVGVVVFDARTGRLSAVNPEANRIAESLHEAGCSAEECIEVATCRFADGRELALNKPDIVQRLSIAETLRAEEIELSVPDGRSMALLVNLTPIRSADGQTVSVVVAAQDLAPLKELDRMRAEFLGTVSHELRAPLAAIKGSSATALGTSRELDPAEVRQFFAIVDEQADQMDRLIHDLLDVGRIETGTLAVNPESIEVAALIDRARSTFVSGGARHDLRIDLPPDMPHVMADRRRIEQVLGNLLANAARHSPESAPIRIAAERDGAHVAVSVADEGAGLTPEELVRLFRKHGADDLGKLRRSGLGLVICKGLVEAHGGRIRAESGGPNRGTRITFTVPIADAQPAGTAADSALPARSRRSPAPILVVDDDPQTLRHLRDWLDSAGYSPIVTGDHRNLSRIIKAEQPHLVLLDLMLPGTDGIELMGTVPELADLPVIFISGYGRDETVARALDSGAVDYIVKPFSPAELTARIRVALRRREEPESFSLGDLVIDYGDRRAMMAGRDLGLTATEYEVLRLLSLRPGRLMTNAQLLDSVWGETAVGDTARLRTIVKKLRRKLGDDAANPTWVFSERGVGYRLVRHEEL